MRFGVCTLAVVACAFLLGGSADSARTQGGADWTLRPVADGQKWLRVNVQGDTLYGFRLRGTNFTVGGIKSVRASGGPAPQCSINGSPATLVCDGALPGGISVFVQLATSGNEGAYEFALLFAPGDTNLLQIPSKQKSPPVPVGGSLGMTSPTEGRVTIHNASGTSFQQLEVAPIGFRVASVRTPDCGVTEGGGIACQGTLGRGRLAVIRFTAEPFSGPPSAVLLGQGSERVGFAYVQGGDPCPDIGADLGAIRAHSASVKTEIARVRRQLSAAELALRGPAFAKAAKEVRAARAKLAGLVKRSSILERAVQVERGILRQCEAGLEHKAGAATACGTEWNASGHWFGVVGGLSTAVPVERRVAAKAKTALVQVKKVGPRGGRGWKAGVAHLGVLVALPAKTQSALARAKSTFARALDAMTACEAALARD